MRSRLALTPLLVAAVLVTGLPGTARAQSFLDSTGVIWMFASQVIGGESSYAVVPVPTSRIRPDMPVRVAVPTAFDLLRADKPATYDGASLRVTDADLASGQAAVVLSGASAQSAPIIIAETVYTFTGLGLERVIFPGLHEEGLTRDDVPFAAYRYRVPMWQAVPPAEVVAADIVLPGGSTMESSAFRASWERGDAALRAALLEYLSSEDLYTLYGATRRVGEHRPPGYEQAVVPLLQHSDPALRQMAMTALAESRATEAWDGILGRMREDTESSLRAQAASMLAESPLEQYHLYATFFRVETASSAERPAVVRELAEIDDQRAREQLSSLLTHPEPDVVEAALGALSLASSWPRLEAAMADEALAASVRMRASHLLAASGVVAHRLSGLAHQVREQEGERAVLAVDQVAEMPGAESRGVLTASLAHSDAVVRTRVAQQLGARGEPEALEGLSVAFAGAGDGERFAEALDEAAFQIQQEQPREMIERNLGAPDSFLRRAAIRALGERAAQEGTVAEVEPTIAALLEDGDARIRGAAVLALGALRTREAFELVTAAADDPTDEVLADVARALSRFDEPRWMDVANPMLSGFVQTGAPAVQSWALLSIGRLNMERLLPIVLQRIDSDVPRVRAAAMEAAADLANPDQPRPVINALTGRVRDELPEIRVVAVQQLSRFNNELAVLGISQVINERDPEVRLAAVIALGDTGHPGAIGPLVSMLEEEEIQVRTVTLGALRALGLRDAAARIEGALDRIDDPTTREAATELAAWLRQHGS